MRKPIIIAILTFSGIIQTLPCKAEKLLSRCSELAINLSLSRQVCDGKIEKLNKQIKGIGIKHNRELVELGIYLRQLGHSEAAKYLMLVALNHISETDERYSEVKLSLANITYSEYKDIVAASGEYYDPEIMRRINTDGYDKAQKAFNEFEDILSAQYPTSVKAGINWLRLWGNLKQNSPTLTNLERLKTPISSIIINKLNNHFSKNLNGEIEYKLNFAEILIHSKISDYSAIGLKYLTQLIQVVDYKNQPKTFSRLYGALGNYYLYADSEKAIDCFLKARNAALQGENLELAYRWNSALGKIYRKQGNLMKSQIAYKEAISQINIVKTGNLPFAKNIQYQTYSTTVPIYQDYLDLLFSYKDPDFSEILRIYELQKRAQVEYFLQCSLVDTVGLSQLSSNLLSDLTIYIIRLPSQYKIVAKLKNGTFVYHTLNSSRLDSLLTETRKYTNSQNLKVISDDNLHLMFGKLYEAILAPFEASLPPNGGSITFVTDLYLQNIPLSALYTPSGDYLLQKFVITYSSGLKSPSKSIIISDNRRILAAGIPAQTQDFPALPAVRTELESIAKIFPKTTLMIDASFNKNDFLNKANDATLIHIASHANFSANPNDTFILSWEERIGLDDLQNLVDLKESSKALPYELLFFSVCEGAKGNQISDLGITGTSLRAGARSAIATIWRTEDESMANLVTRFYFGLSHNLTIAEALRAAQIEAMHSQNPKFRKFANWAGIGLYEN